MSCLRSEDVQAVADGEASHEARAHGESCTACRARVEERRRLMARLAAATAHDMPSHVSSRIADAVRRGTSAPATTVATPSGATVLRGASSHRWRRAGLVSALATAAAVAVYVFAVLPHMGAPTELSAAEILGKSLNTLTSATGIERLEYQLTVGGLAEGEHRVEHLIDHGTPARYRLANFGPDGLLRSAVAQDPATGRRSQLIRLDGRTFIVHVQAGGTMLSMPEMAQAQIEAVIGMMQATADQKLTVLETPEGKQYVIEMPPVAPAGSGVAFDLHQARAVVDGRDFRIREFDATGSVLKQPYTISFRLLHQERLAASAVTAADFAIEPSAGDVVLEGEPADAPVADVVHAALREVARLRSDR